MATGRVRTLAGPRWWGGVLAGLIAWAAAPSQAQTATLSFGGSGFVGTAGSTVLYRARPRESFFPDWLVWWETRREGFVADRWPDGVPPEPDAAWEQARDAAAEALVEAWVNRGGDRPRWEAELVLALGRVGGPRAEAVLIADGEPLASPHAAVRGTAAVALGLLGTEAARTLLRERLRLEAPAAVAAAAAGMALLPELTDADAEALLQTVRRGPGDDARRLALQALSVQGAAVNPRLMPGVLREVPRVFLVEQALLAAPDFADRDDQRLLTNFLSAGGRLRDLPVLEEVRLLGPLLFRGSAVVSPQRAAVEAEDSDNNADRPAEAEEPAPRLGRPTTLRLRPRRWPNPLEQRLESAAAFGLARLRPSEDGFGETAVEELAESVFAPSTPGLEPSRAASLLALAFLLAEDEERLPAVLLRFADGDEIDVSRDRGPRIRRFTAAGSDEPDPATLEHDAVRSFGLLSAAVLVRRLSAAPDAVAVFPFRLDANDEARVRRVARRTLMDTAADTNQPRGVRCAAATGLGLAADRREPAGEGRSRDALVPGGGLSFDPEAVAAGDPVVLGHLLGSLETLARTPMEDPASEAAAAAVRERTDRFLAGIAGGARERPLTYAGVAAARRVVQSLAWRPAEAPLDAALLESLAAADPFLAVEVASACRWRNDPRPGRFFAGRLGLPGPGGVAAARSLGALFDARSPSGLYRLARTTNPVVLFRDDAPHLLSRLRGAGVPRFRSAAWWIDPSDSRVLDGWPGREELALVNPYLAERVGR